MRRVTGLGAAMLVAVAGTARGQAGPAAVARQPILAVTAARLIDGSGGAPLERPVVLIEGDRITAVGRDLPILAGARRTLEAGLTKVRDLGAAGVREDARGGGGSGELGHEGECV